MKTAVIAALALSAFAGCGERDRWTIHDNSFYPVAIDYWRDDRSFLVGSYEHGGIARMTAEGVSDVKPFIPPSFAEDGRKKALRISIDSPRDRLWVLDTDRVYAYSLRTRQRLARFDLPQSSRASSASCLPDMALNPSSGAVYIADGREPKLHEIYEESSSEALIRTELRLKASGGEALGVISALAIVAEAQTIIAASAETNTLYRINALTGETRQITVANPELLKGICALRAVSESPSMRVSGENMPRQFYFTSVSSNALYGLSLLAGLEQAQAVALTRAQALETPIAIAPMSGYVIATSSQLGRHRDLGGSGDAQAPFRLIAIPAPIGPPAGDRSIAKRPLR